jgi:predicted RNase H-like HicB family nuclease
MEGNRMRSYYGVVHKDNDSAYGVHFPDLPGCFSAADSLDDIVAQAGEAVSLYFEGNDDIITPSSLACVRDVAAGDIAEGAFVILVPYIQNTSTLARVNISLDTGMLAAIDMAASSRKLTRSAFLAQAARREIEGR